MLWRSNQRRLRYGYNHLEWPPRIMGFIHSRNVCQKEVITLGRRRRSLTHNKRREDGSNWRSSSHHPKKIPQAMRNMNISTLEEPLIHLSIWIINNAIMNVEDYEAKGSRRSLPMKQIKISIQFSFHDIVLLYIWLYLGDVLCMIDCLH